MGDLVGIEGGKQKTVEVELIVIECGHCESSMFSWRVAVDNPKHHVLACCICGMIYPMLESEQSDVLSDQ
tara:strand:+ start:1172 stop:1381 length:210 start_codon:yes stop_codon:yes gene_type:complete